MPELPEVETIRRDLGKKIIRKKIAAVEILDKQRISPAAHKFAAILKGSTFKSLERRGKLLILNLAKGDLSLLIHLKMTGQLIYRYDHRTTRGEHSRTIYGGHDVPKTANGLPNKFSRVIFRFADKSVLYFNDLRRFGYLKIVDAEGRARALSRFGPDALEGKISLKYFQDLFVKRKKGKLKAVLLDQKALAGIGNIYADEICFLAGVRPERRAKSLTASEIKKLHHYTGQVLRHAIRHRGTTFGTYVDGEGKRGNFVDFLKVYQREKEKCLRCKKGIIQKTQAGGRGTRFCPNCQK